ncbi:MAG TPA: hypothetical protein VGA18_09110, partial [Rhodothermales bacterium]
MSIAPSELYLSLMRTIRSRFDLLDALRGLEAGGFSKAETAAFQGRKIVEVIAFGCLVATEQGLKHVPHDAKGQWAADAIFKSLRKKGISTFPSPSIIRRAVPEDYVEGINVVIEGVPERRISSVDMEALYVRLHKWLHELNPYVTTDRATFLAVHETQLWEDLQKVERFIERHFISIRGEGFYCVLRDSVDGLTKVKPLSKRSDLYPTPIGPQLPGAAEA